VIHLDAKYLTATSEFTHKRVEIALDVARLNRNEWEAFLSEFSELTKKYELLLSELDLSRTKIEGLQEKTKQQVAKSGEALRQVRGAVDKLCDETEEMLNEPE